MVFRSIHCSDLWVQTPTVDGHTIHRIAATRFQRRLGGGMERELRRMVPSARMKVTFTPENGIVNVKWTFRPVAQS
jgi:hypothetical protein